MVESAVYKILVCGGRDYNNYSTVKNVLDYYAKQYDLTIIHGGARGADSLATQWFEETKDCVLIICPAKWLTYGKKAGPIRNQYMLETFKPDMVIAFPGGNGTAHMVKIARNAGVKITEVYD